MVDFSCQAMEDRVLAALNGGATALMISLGHRTGMFDAMAEFGDGEFRTSKGREERRAGWCVGLVCFEIERLSLPPPPPPDIAARAHGLNERYVRELLNGLVSAKIVHHSTTSDSDGGRVELYLLPASARGCLTRAAAPNNMAVSSQFIPMVGQVRQKRRVAIIIIIIVDLTQVDYGTALALLAGRGQPRAVLPPRRRRAI